MWKGLQCILLVTSVLSVSLFDGKNIGLTKEIDNLREGVICAVKQESVYTDGFWIEEDETVYLLQTYEKTVLELKKKSTREIVLSEAVLPADIICDNEKLYIFDDLLYELQIYTKQGELLVRSKINLKDDYVKGLLNTTEGVAVLTYSGEYIVIDSETGKQKTLKKETVSKVDCAGYDYAEHVGTDEDGNVYSIHTMLVRDCSVLCGELTLQAVSPEGKKLGSYVLPVEEYAYLPGTYIQVLGNGNIYLLVPTEQTVEVRKISLKQETDSRLEEIENTAETLEAKYVSDTRYRKRTGTACTEEIEVSREEVWKRANAMANHKWTMKRTNTLTSKSEPGVDLPREIAAIKAAREGNAWSAELTGIPYCWGGFYALDVGFKNLTFDEAISKKYVAGNINSTGYYKYMTAGLDCSGFVSAAFKLKSKQSTRGLSDVGSKISDVRKMEQMDLLVQPGEHIIFFCGWLNDTTMLVAEAAKREGKVIIHPKTVNELVVNSKYQMRAPW